MSGRHYDDKKGADPIIFYLATSQKTGNTVWHDAAILVISPTDNQPVMLINHHEAGFSSHQGYLLRMIVVGDDRCSVMRRFSLFRGGSHDRQ
ncbi:hypothetical protein Dd586_2330 [Dickeya parazeae Ech586]|uniref:Uncharacterized protein n=1 Tax=Dickeya zeae (strain Ech586) TaxID=590409 RepID=D2C1N7_DICZ5|nr:hypothetical protein Dd586_2330 [Dickeya parazeae Ech586]